MKRTALISTLIAVGALGFTAAANAQDVGCDDIVWGSEILADNPNIGDACLDVVEKGGVMAAKFTARVVRQSVNSTIVQWQLPDGSWSASQRRFPERGSVAEISGETVRITDLAARQEMNVYLPVGEYWTLPAPEPEAAAAPPPPPPPAPEPEPEPEPAALPTTATQVPAFALLGGLLLLLGGAVSFVRNRL
ncbi:MAG: hypothetical protein P8Y52_11280 [Xanthomonadales bacterium]